MIDPLRRFGCKITLMKSAVDYNSIEIRQLYTEPWLHAKETVKLQENPRYRYQYELLALTYS